VVYGELAPELAFDKRPFVTETAQHRAAGGAGTREAKLRGCEGDKHGSV